LAILPRHLPLITIHILDCCQFFDIHISQGSVATYLRCDGIFKYDFVANLPLSLPVKEFWKYVNIWRSYEQEFSVFLDSRCITAYNRNRFRSPICRYYVNYVKSFPAATWFNCLDLLCSCKSTGWAKYCTPNSWP